jgi:hypothetical protein
MRTAKTLTSTADEETTTCGVCLEGKENEDKQTIHLFVFRYVGDGYASDLALDSATIFEIDLPNIRTPSNSAFFRPVKAEM